MRVSILINQNNKINIVEQSTTALVSDSSDMTDNLSNAKIRKILNQIPETHL
jgi:hypothetical protein